MSDDRLMALTELYMVFTEQLISSHNFSGMECGTTMLAVGLKIMKTVLSEEDFAQFIKEIPDSEARVSSLAVRVADSNLH